jgi:four helix bundle protein
MDQPAPPNERPASFEGGQDIRDRALDYACRVVDFCQKLSEGPALGRLMVSQLLSCSLSFATMLEEARAAESDADFISKCCIGLKEIRESWTRMRVCLRCRIGPHREAAALVQEGSELISIVATIVKNKRRSVGAKVAARTAEQVARRSATAGPANPATNS